MTFSTKRREKRVRAALPVRLFGLDFAGRPFTDVACTLDISRGGARVGGLKYTLAVGDVVGLQRGNDKARFRVCWVGAQNTRCANQAGLCCIQPEKCIWPAELLERDAADISSLNPGVPSDHPLAVTTPSPERERRTDYRYNCNLPSELELEGSSVKLWARCTDLSDGGCYIETRSPLTPNTTLHITILNKGVAFRAAAIVRTSHPHFGMGVQFTELTSEMRAVLDTMLAEFAPQLEYSTAVPISPPVQIAEVRRRTVALLECFRALEADLGHSELHGEVRNEMRSALSTIRPTAVALQQIVDSPGCNDSELVSGQFLLNLVRTTTACALRLGADSHLPTTLETAEGIQLQHAIGALNQRIMQLCETTSGSLAHEPAHLPTLAVFEKRVV